MWAFVPALAAMPAGQRVIKGIVTDAQTKESLIGASVTGRICTPAPSRGWTGAIVSADCCRGVFLVEAAIHTVVDSAGLKAAYEECISRVGGIRLAMPEEGEWVVVGCTDRSRLG